MEVGQHAGLGLHYTFSFLPFQLLLPSPLGYGTKISVQGTIPALASRFSVNLQTVLPKKTVVFHFNPRFSEGPVVVRNTCIEGSWGKEERALDSTEFPFAHKADFCMVITPNEKGYEVVVNGSPLLNYEHRLPLEDVTHLCVEGDVFIQYIDIAVTLPSKLIASIPNNLRPGDLIIVKGQLPSGAQRFMINLQAGPGDQDDICLHINPRIDESSVVRNTRLNNSWGSEDVSGGNPLTQGRSFVLVVAALLNLYKILINSKHFANYEHRCPPNSVTHLLVDGDVTVSEVYIDSEPNFLSAQFQARKLTLSEIKVQALCPEVPSFIAIPGGLIPGHVLIVEAVPSKGAQRFAINLQKGECESGDMAVHMNPRWDDGPRVVLNSRRDGQWAEETTVASCCAHAFPFADDRPFHLLVQCQSDRFALQLDGRPLATYPYPFDPSTVDCLSFMGHLYVLRALLILS